MKDTFKIIIKAFLVCSIGYLLGNYIACISTKKEYRSALKKVVQLQDDIRHEQTSLIKLQNRLNKKLKKNNY